MPPDLHSGGGYADHDVAAQDVHGGDPEQHHVDLQSQSRSVTQQHV